MEEKKNGKMCVSEKQLCDVQCSQSLDNSGQSKKIVRALKVTVDIEHVIHNSIHTKSSMQFIFLLELQTESCKLKHEHYINIYIYDIL